MIKKFIHSKIVVKVRMVNLHKFVIGIEIIFYKQVTSLIESSKLIKSSMEFINVPIYLIFKFHFTLEIEL